MGRRWKYGKKCPWSVSGSLETKLQDRGRLSGLLQAITVQIFEATLFSRPQATLCETQVEILGGKTSPGFVFPLFLPNVTNIRAKTRCDYQYESREASKTF